MHENNIKLLREEAQRLISFEQELLGRMLLEQDLLTKAASDERQSLDRESAPKEIERLKGEAVKLENLDMVLAVVGTMKAGKSTTINAIVGTEVLPNRNAPMTAIPTLIRHTPGQLTPCLEFTNRQPIDRLVKALQARLQDPCHADEVARIRKGEDDQCELIEKILSGEGISAQCEGADAIFGFLKGLNDLVRLAPALGLEFPFTDYDEVHELPVIKVEFAHLREMEQSSGRLTLLDTPGPNEAGQNRLRPMLQEQLRKASAVLAVLDYTQLKSEADAQVRADLLAIADEAEGRIYAVVNKFDQRDRNGMNEQEVKSFVSELMGRLIVTDRVFPVSSKFAYLANRARHELKLAGRLPDAKQQPWVADFGEEAFGRRWQQMIGDPEEIAKNAEVLWQDSYFNMPLEGVIRTAHANAAILAVDSAASKIDDVAQDIGNLCAQRETALSKSASELKRLAEDIQNDIARIDTCEKQAQHSQEEHLRRFSEQLASSLMDVRKKVGELLEGYFQEGKLREKEVADQRAEEAKKLEEQQASFGVKLLKNLFGHALKVDREPDFDPDSPEINFYANKEAAQALISRIEKSVEGVLGAANKSIEHGLDEAMASFEKSFQGEVLGEARKTLDGLKDRLDKDGFGGLNLELPPRSALQLKLSGARMLSDAIEAKSRTVTRTRKQSGAWGGFKRLISFGHLGHESYDESVTDYKVDIREVRKAVLAGIEEDFGGLDKELAELVQKPLQESVERFFKAFRENIEKVRGNFLQSLRDKKLERQAQDKLLKSLKTLRSNVQSLQQDGRALKEQVGGLLPEASRVER